MWFNISPCDINPYSAVGTMDVIEASPGGTLFKRDNMCFGASGAGNKWARGHYTECAELIDEAVDIIRRETEKSNSPQGFQVTQSQFYFITLSWIE